MTRLVYVGRNHARLTWLVIVLASGAACDHGGRRQTHVVSKRAVPSSRVEGVRVERVARRPLSLRAARGRLSPGVLHLEEVSGRVGGRHLRAARVDVGRSGRVVARDFELAYGALHLAGRRLELDLYQGALDAHGVRLDLDLGSRRVGASRESRGADPPRAETRHAQAPR